MCVSGSLIISSTWRSSSVSAPSMRRSIFLLQFEREVADEARQLRPGIADRLHARLHDAFLQLGRDVDEALQRRRELAVLLAAQDLQQLVAGQHQLADHRHQILEQVDIDADALTGDRRVLALGLACGGRCRRLLRDLDGLGGCCLGGRSGRDGLFDRRLDRRRSGAASATGASTISGSTTFAGAASFGGSAAFALALALGAAAFGAATAASPLANAFNRSMRRDVVARRARLPSPRAPP